SSRQSRLSADEGSAVKGFKRSAALQRGSLSPRYGVQSAAWTRRNRVCQNWLQPVVRSLVWRRWLLSSLVLTLFSPFILGLVSSRLSSSFGFGTAETPKRFEKI